ncbi:phage major capsid protein [Kutzneria chonburiensis]|uniref:Phage major capsid protein n=1 Tax=Kutzneria chonburiensis TaxID=1483604 RepID=A0ABV6N4K0_9PSEU|nr:phage major capsid protein [Kutzneria chonburiensis]
MSPVLEARTAMRALALKAKHVVDDKDMAMADKKSALVTLSEEMQKHSDTIEVYEKAALLCKGGDSAEDKDHPLIPAQRRSLGEQLVASKGYAELAAAVSPDGGRKRFGTTVEVKSTPTPPPVINEGTTVGAGGFLDGVAAPLILPNYQQQMVELLFPELNIADLFAQGSTSSPIITWVEETEFVNAAAPVAEGELKPTSSDAVERLFEQVGKIAHLLRMTDEMVMDAEQFKSFLDSRMNLGIRLKEQDGLINGTGYPGIRGLLQHAAGFQTAMSANGSTNVAVTADTIFSQITAVRWKAFMEPDTVLINPFDWEHIKLGKDANGQYYAGGPFQGAYGVGSFTNVDSLWGKRVVLTPTLAQGTCVVGAFKAGGQIFRRQGIVSEMSNSNNDDFEHNRVTIRAEERLALVIYRPAVFGIVNLAWS